MAVNSMTGFARAAGSSGAWRWAFEVKTVNTKGLDGLHGVRGVVEIDEAEDEEALAAAPSGRRPRARDPSHELTQQDARMLWRVVARPAAGPRVETRKRLRRKNAAG